jgi:hypothetical protein
VSRGNDGIYHLNLAALAARSPRLAAEVERAEALAIELASSRSGQISAKAGGAWLHSRYDPAEEGRKIASEAMSSGAELFVVLGLGLGYPVRALLASGARVAVVEADPGWIKTLLAAADMRDILADTRADLILCPGGLGLDDYLSAVSPRSITLVENRATTALFQDATASLREQAGRFMRRDAINAATLGRFGRLWARNLICNIRTATALPGVASLAGRFQGIPALVLAAGPSLDQVVERLPALRERCVVIAVDTALRSILRVGIEPDFIVVVDPQYWNARHLDGCRSPRSVLITEAAVWPSVLRFESRATILCSSIYPLGRYVEERLGPPKGSLGAGGSVATTAWDFARTLGCVPVCMAGLDLSFPGGKTHAKASLFEQRSLDAGNRLLPASSASFQAMRGGNPFQAPANDCSMVTSDERLSLYSSWFSRKLADQPETPTWNLSSGGLAIPGMAYIPFSDMLAFEPVRGIIDERLDDVLASLGSIGDLGPAVERIVGELAQELRRIAGLSGSAVKIALDAIGNDAGHVSEALARLSNVDQSVIQSPAHEVVGFFFSSAADAIGTKPRTLDDSLRNTARLYGAVAESALWHAGRLENQDSG